MKTPRLPLFVDPMICLDCDKHEEVITDVCCTIAGQSVGYLTLPDGCIKKLEQLLSITRRAR